MKKCIALVLVLGLILLVNGWVAAAGLLKVGATPVPHAEILEFVKPLLVERGIELEIIVFNDYVQPNLAVAEGELDANYFQHVPYLETFRQDHHLNLDYLATVHIEPLGLYSQKISKIDDLTGGAVIALPNDPTNEGRALHLLQANGLIKIDPAVGLAATPLDIVENPLKLEFRELEAAQLPRVLADVDGAIINTNYALPAGLVPLKDALLIEGSDSPYANILTVRGEDVQNENLRILAEILVSDEVEEFIIQNYEGAIVPAQALKGE